ncbi:hypothetical protein [Arthrobacter sp. ISL-28]|uniref:hypothetical protein n=1 Tax=Arthrobacter sp. ISL-28 TaxID=2819108 RepID=UPI001BE5B7C8|nr:hypothetical protein [Arthrobacter sp. ISL-28]MBT2523274.1 hypothetical protein [Arthrobacter sp. ISL-28]
MDIGAFMALQDWGSLPDWFAAAGTIGAVAWALYVGRRDGKRLDAERLEAKADREEAAADRALFRQQQSDEAEARKRRLAAKVTVIAEKTYIGPESIRGYEGRGIRWKVHNGGDEPILMVSVVQRPMPNEEGAETAVSQISKTWPAIEPGGFREEVTPLYSEEWHPEREVQFTDGSGQRWQRKAYGGLRTISPDDPDALRMVML